MDKQLIAIIWKLADLLRNKYSGTDIPKIILPLFYFKFIKHNLHNDISFHELGKENSFCVNNRLETIFSTDRPLLNQLIDLLNTIPDDIANMKIVGEAIDFLFEKIYKNVPRGMGEYTTPDNLNELLVSLLSPIDKNMTIYDPFSGLGKSLLAFGTDHKLFGQEINLELANFSQLNLALHGVKEFDIKSGDTILNPLHQGKKFDRIISAPPFGVNYPNANVLLRGSNIYSIETNRLEGLAIQHIISKLNKSGKAAIILSLGFLFSSARAEIKIREYLIENNFIETVIQLPPGMFPHTTIPAAIIVINVNKAERKDIKFIKHNVRKNLDQIIETANSPEGIKEFSFNIDGDDINVIYSINVTQNEIRKNDYNLLPERFTSREIKELEVIFAKYNTRLLNLGDIANIRSFRHVPADKLASSTDRDSTENAIPYVTLESVLSGLGTIDKLVVISEENSYLQQEILSTANGAQNGALATLRGNEVESMEYDPLVHPAIIPSNSIFYITPKNPELFSVRYLLSYLESELCEKQILSKCLGEIYPRLTKKQLITLKVPALNKDEQLEFIKEQESIRATKSSYINYYHDLINSLKVTKDQTLEEKIADILANYTNADAKFYFDWEKYFPAEKDLSWFRLGKDVFVLIKEGGVKYGVVELVGIGLNFSFSMINEIQMVLAFVIQSYQSMISVAHDSSMHMIAHNMKNKLSNIKKLLDDVHLGLIYNNVPISTMKSQSDGNIDALSDIFEEPRKNETILETIGKIYDQLRDISTNLYYTDPPALFNLANELTALVDKQYESKAVKLTIIKTDNISYDHFFSKMALIEPLKVFIDNALEHSGSCLIEVGPESMVIANELKNDLSEEQKEILMNFTATVSVKTNSWGIGRHKAKEIIENKIGTVECRLQENEVLHIIHFDKLGGTNNG